MWDEEKVYFNTNNYFASVVLAIDSAQSTVDVEMYIFSRDRIGGVVLSALTRAASRGVSVRLILDGMGSPSWRRADLQALAKENVFVRVYHPVPRPFSQLFQQTWPRPAFAVKLLLNINRRNHKKLVLIDQKKAFAGSMNVSDEHATWRETSVLVKGDDVRELQAYFEVTWSKSFFLGLKPSMPFTQASIRSTALSLVRTNITRKLRRHHNNELIARIQSAKKRVWLTSAYFVPSPRMISSLIRAARSGVDVRVLLPRKSDVKLVRWVSILSYWPLLGGGVSIYEYLPSMMHAKTTLIDRWATIGSTNLNHRSLYHDLEVDIVLKKTNTIKDLADQFRLDQQASEKITQYWLDCRPPLMRVGGYFGSFVKWWL
jgi:cardiolipin synthase